MPKQRVIGERIDLGLLRALMMCLIISANLPALGGALPPESQAWFEVPTRTFTLIANVHEQRAVEIARELESFRQALEAEVPGLSDPSRPVTIYAFDSRRTLRRHYPTAPRAIGGVFLRSSSTDVILVDAGTRLRQQHACHEYVHFRLRSSFVALPAWLNEGLAYYFQTFSQMDGGAEVGGAVPGLRRRKSTSLRRVLDATTAWESEYYATRSFARQSWMLVHYLLSRPDQADPLLPRLLSVAGGGSHVATGLPEILGVSLPQLETAVNGYFGAGALKTRRIQVDTADAQHARDDSIVRRLEYPEVLVRLAELAEAAVNVDANVDAVEARTLFDEALKRSPTNTRALLGSARGLTTVGSLAEAHARVDEALERDPANALGYLLRGKIAMGEFSAWRRDRPDGLPQVLHPSIVKARHAFGHAMGLDPDLLPAVRGYARTFLFDPETRLPGIEACRNALANRNNLDLALTLVELYSDDADRESAHATRKQWVLPLRGGLAIHRTNGGPTAWTRVEDALARYDILLAERLYESGSLDEAKDVLSGIRAWGTTKHADRIGVLLSEISAQSSH